MLSPLPLPCQSFPAKAHSVAAISRRFLLISLLGGWNIIGGVDWEKTVGFQGEANVSRWHDRAILGPGDMGMALSEAGADSTSFAIIGSTINSHVVVFDLNDYYNPILSFNTFPDILTPNGVYVASGDLDRDNLNEIVVGAGQGTASPQVAVFGMDGKLKKSFNAFDMSFLGGVQVGVADYNKDGKLDILAASGVGAPGTLNVFNYDNLALLDTLFISDSTLGCDVASNFSRGQV